MAKNFFKKHGIAYEDINVQENEEEGRKIMERTKQTTIPVIIIDDIEVIVGFDEAKLRSLLEIKD